MKKWSILIVRYLLGTIFMFNGLNFFFQFVPLLTPDKSELAQRFLMLLDEGGYFYPIISGVTLLTALALLTNRFLPLLLIVKFPLTLNGVLFHIRMDPAMTPVAVAVALMHFYLIYVNREKYFPMLSNGVK
jgi:putative oxidoreductase